MKLINLTEELKQNMLDVAHEQVENIIKDYKGDGDINIKLDPNNLCDLTDVVKPVVYLTPTACTKIIALVKRFDKELAWHGTVSKVGTDYIIHDIFMYPQIVTGTTVESDDVEYAKWLMELPDEVINNLRFQGHSHVNMGVSPSGTDLTNWQNFSNMLGANDFYIFCITNKRNEYTWCIYDKAQNVIFENKDITYSVLCDEQPLGTWAEETIDKNVQKPTTTYTDFYGNPIKDLHKKASIKHNNNPGIPPALLSDPDIVYDPDDDKYYTVTPHSGFSFDRLSLMYACDGQRCRKLYGDPYKTIKKKTNTGKKGGKK